jgi:hypothetical protein
MIPVCVFVWDCDPCFNSFEKQIIMISAFFSWAVIPCFNLLKNELVIITVCVFFLVSQANFFIMFALWFGIPGEMKNVLLSLSALLFWYPRRMKNVLLSLSALLFWYPRRIKKRGFIITVCVLFGIPVCIFVWVPQAKEKQILYPWLRFVWYANEIISVHLHCIINQTTNLFGRL